MFQLKPQVEALVAGEMRAARRLQKRRHSGSMLGDIRSKCVPDAACSFVKVSRQSSPSVCFFPLGNMTNDHCTETHGSVSKAYFMFRHPMIRYI